MAKDELSMYRVARQVEDAGSPLAAGLLRVIAAWDSEVSRGLGEVLAQLEDYGEDIRTDILARALWEQLERTRPAGFDAVWVARGGKTVMVRPAKPEGAAKPEGEAG